MTTKFDNIIAFDDDDNNNNDFLIADFIMAICTTEIPNNCPKKAGFEGQKYF